MAPPVSRAGESPELALIEEFKKGYTYVPERMGALARAAQQLLTSSALSAEERVKLQSTMAEMDKSLGDLQNLCRQVVTSLGSENIKKDATRDFHSFFTGDFNDHRLSFLAFLKAMIHLKRFSLEASEIWNRVRSRVVDADLQPLSEFRTQFLDFRIQPGLHMCSTISTFADRMGKILRLQKDPLSVKALTGMADYSPDTAYQLSAVFADNVNDDALATYAEEGPPDAMGDEQVFAREVPAAPADRIVMPKGGRGPHFVDTTGSMAWNTGPSYVFSYEPAALEEERRSFRDVIYVDTHMGADQNFIKTDLILRYSRKTPDPAHQNPEEAYTKFLTDFFNLVMDISLLNLSIPAKFRNVFFYHLGPQYFYHLTRRFLFESKTGTMHKKAATSRLVQKFIPGELTKKVVLDYWRDTLMPALGAERDDFALYKRVVKMVKDAYDEFGRRAMTEYDQLPEGSKAATNRNQLIRENLAKWLGTTNIIIFRRFLKTQVG